MNKLVVCNQKMFLSYDEAKHLQQEMMDIDYNKLIVCPSYLNIGLFKDFNLGAQDCFYEDNGSFTGLVSSYHLSLIGVKYVIVGHSENRDKNSDEEINLKVKSILRNSMIPILCIGETKIEKDMRRTSEVLKRQITSALKNVVLDNFQEIILAYEPRWIIGTNYQITKNEIIDSVRYIKKLLENIGINKYKVIYGGNIHSKNILSIDNDDLDGYLLGSASISSDEIKEIIKCIK